MRIFVYAVILMAGIAMAPDAHATCASSITDCGDVRGKNGVFNNLTVVSGLTAAITNQTISGTLAVGGDVNLLNKMRIGAGSNLIFADVPFWINAPSAGIGGAHAIHEGLALTGTSTDSPSIINYFASLSDNITNASGVNFFNIIHNFGGAAATGPRNAFVVQQNLNATMGDRGAGGFAAGQFYFFGNVNNGGTSFASQSTMSGSAFSLNTVIQLSTGATFYNGMIGYELDMVARTGSSMNDKIGMMITQVAGDVVSGNADDIGLSINNQIGTSGWKYGIMFGRQNGYWPMKSTGTMIGAQTLSGSMTASNGIDWSGVTFSGNAWNSTGATIDGSGNIKGLTFKVGANQVVGARQTGWTAMTGTPNIAATYDTSTVTLAQLAGRVMSLQAALATHGLTGP